MTEHTSVETDILVTLAPINVQGIARKFGAVLMATVWLKQSECRKEITTPQAVAIRRAFASQAGRIPLVTTPVPLRVSLAAARAASATSFPRLLLSTLTLVWLVLNLLPCPQIVAPMLASVRGMAAASIDPHPTRARTLPQ